ncbi:alpha/beta hydrolase [Roseomonas hellenica]|uniref:Alpha/beta hydrolase n=1 Tax=Plastoroseomonas hellenica TaxID=2687306 RepID=A0ABS5F6L9_9PROT|nr:alpha/beta hydrolase [Plastoroseomonas hellenica]MBR0668192.1 alpha/beta hydrolase [Plastoroseomonas hellenica]
MNGAKRSEDALPRRAALALGLGLPVLARGAAAASGRLDLPEAAGATADPMPVWYHRPEAWRPGGPVVAVLHGVRRDGENYRNAWVPHAERLGFLLLVPEFTAAKFPGVRWYNFGNAGDDAGHVQPRDAWCFAVLDRAVAGARTALDAGEGGFALYGHSAGAQFAHRYLLLGGGAATRVVVANAGWYSMPDPAEAFPYGLSGLADDAALRAAFARPALILLGEADTDPHHPALRRDAQADRQGLYRFARGQAFFAAATARAAALGMPLAWALRTVPGVGHSNAGMAIAAAPLLLGA